MSNRPAELSSAPASTGERRLPPEPHAHFLVGLLPEFRRDALGTLAKLGQEYPDAVRVPLGTVDAYFFFSPEAVKRILQDNNHNYVKPKRSMDALRTGLRGGESVFTADGEIWLHQRRLMQPAFHRQRIAAFGSMMTGSALQMLDRWEGMRDRPIEVESEMTRLTLTVAGRALFSADLNAEASELGRAFTTLLGYATYRLNTPWAPPIWIPTHRNHEFVQQREVVWHRLQEMIQARRQSGTDQGDFLSMLMEARDEDTGEGMSDDEIMDEAQTLLAAGHETTANTLTWTFYLLSQHPEADARLHAEIDETLGGRTPAVADIPNLRYTRMVIDETLRLYPPAWIFPREAVHEDELAGYRVPAGAQMELSPWVTHRLPSLWENPDAFAPERFSPERIAARPHFAYMPFGGGPRQCIGMNFALTEAVLVLATVVQRYRLRLVEGHPVEPFPLFTIRTRNKLPMWIEPRK